MLKFIVWVMEEYAASRRLHQLLYVHNFSLQENASLIEMLNRSSPIRCHGLLCDKLKTKNYLKSWYNSIKQFTMFLLTLGDNCRNFLIQDVFQHLGKW